MLKNYFTIAWRNLIRNRLYSFINIGGLALGLSACILILFYVRHEKSYDSFLEDANRLFKIRAQMVMSGDTIYTQALNFSAADQLKEINPSVQSTLRLFSEYKPVVIKNPKSTTTQHSEINFRYADDNFFDFFSFKLLKGNPKAALKNPYSLVISEEMAQKYFGNENPIGQNLQIKKDSTYLFKVTGIIENSRSNSTISTDFIASINSHRTMVETKRNFEYSIFRGGAYPTYVKLNDINKVAQVEKSMNDLGSQTETGANDTYILTALTDQHLNYGKTSISKYLNIFPLVALLILLLALINYLSLSTARATLRSKEIGVRKVNGASRKNVAIQFYVESTVYVSLAFLLAILVAITLQPWFFSLLNLTIDQSFFLDKSFILLMVGLYGATILLTGLYPAVLMSSFNPIDNLRLKRYSNQGGISLRKACTVVQFVIAVGLIICGIIIHQQLSHMRQVDVGLNRSDLLMIPLQKTMGTNSTAFRNEIEQLPQVKSTAAADYPLYRGYNIFFASSGQGDDQISLPIFNIDESFFKTLGVKWKIAPSDETLLTAENKVIVNESTIKKFHLSPYPIGQSISLGNSKYDIVGLVENFHFSNIDAPIDALAMFVSDKSAANTTLLGELGGCLFVKFQSNTDLQGMVSRMESIHSKFDAESPFEYEFLDDAFDNMFKSEKTLSYIFNIFIVITFIIAGMGLFGLAAFTAQQKIKEIGIRKVLGASVYQIASHLSFGFFKLVGVAILIAIPLAWYFMQDWLQDFKYKIEIEWWVFVLASFATLLITFLTVGFETIRASVVNPVKSLRTE
ncbi:ABC transporter permease [Aegicerativicinus sediminis]|uniref:ABC transporter permease n=1 Tax=Aegicerativicinus sediminis TaxID=2893202 RepID=UPI001E384F9E|nr:ABC transporter permease [Aegicerativicinus sediminis]